MSLTFEKSQQKSYGKGIYVDNAKIIGIEDKTGEQRFEKTPDLFLVLKLSIPGLSFEPTVELAGNFKRDDNGQVTGWGGAYAIRDLFHTFGIKGELNADYTLPDSVLEQLVGKDVMRLTYVSKKKEDGSNKLSYSTWTKLAIADESEEGKQKFANSFVAEWQKTGFPKNYHPEILDNESITFPGPDVPASLPDEDYI